ncbi:nucleotidyltransferase domain-containing protein [Streptacidiphilus griseoplanus]|uniref:nucleotidyltransferase domain-containing protein n=1 Tax=Peterkaempfera griseoplana TaxID=66896 RepID=UPI0006E3D629|nr:nucleotidyltransferase domain-containing protein [Peterkaempfera griseoplana]
MHLLLSGIVGSTAYGLAHAGSDVDRLGLFAAPTEDLHGLHRPAESQVSTRPDRTLHEAAKWCRLALSGNPTVMELVWLPGELYEVRTPLGDELIGLRGALLSAHAVRNAYLGYATQQFRKLRSRDHGVLSDETRRRSAKHARHLVRLTEQAVELHRTGRLTIRLADPERVRELGERVVDDPSAGERIIARAQAALDGPGVLPQSPDEASVEAWLRRVRAFHYTREPIGA